MHHYTRIPYRWLLCIGLLVSVLVLATIGAVAAASHHTASGPVHLPIHATVSPVPELHSAFHTSAFTATTAFTIGFSVQQQPIQAVRIGDGSRVVVIIGAIHGGTEANSSVLVRELLVQFQTMAASGVLPADVSLYLVPMVNPDGVRGGTRYNANGVDLNRNWATDDWQPDSFDASGMVVGGGGMAPFSEPETAALSAWLLDLRVQTSSRVMVLSYHSQYPPAGLVLPGSAGSDLTRSFAAALGYTYAESFTSYPLSGQLIDWCADHQISCFETELPDQRNPTDAQVQRHTQAIFSVLILGQSDARCFLERGVCIAGRIREFWEQNGGLPVFGYPISPQQEAVIEGQSLQVQWFERVRLELHPQNAPPYDVLVSRLGVEWLEQQQRSWWEFPRSAPQEGCRFFAETGHNICGEMLETWRSNGLELDGQAGTSEAESLALFGMPISDAQTETLSDGKEYVVQWYERSRLELHPQNEPPYHVQSGLLGSEVYGGQ